MAVECQLIFQLPKLQLLTSPSPPFETFLESLFWKVLLRAPQKFQRDGFLGVTGAAVLPEKSFDPEAIRSEIEGRLTSVLAHLFKQRQPDYDTVTGRTKYGPYKLGLTYTADLDILKKRLKADRSRLRQIVERENLSDKEKSAANHSVILSETDVRHRIAVFLEVLPTDYKTLEESYHRLQTALRAEMAERFQKHFNAELYEQLVTSPPTTLIAKKKIQAWVKEQLDRHGFSIRHPKDGTACDLITLSGHDGNGVFLLESHEGRKRSHTTQDLHSMLELPIMALELARPPRGRHATRG